MAERRSATGDFNLIHLDIHGVRRERRPYPSQRWLNKVERRARKNLAAFLHTLEPPTQPLRTFAAGELFDAAAFPAGTIVFFKLGEKPRHHGTMHWGVVEKYKDEEGEEEKSIILSYFIKYLRNDSVTPDYPFGKFEGGSLQVGETTRRQRKVTMLQLYHIGEQEEHKTLLEKINGLLHPVGLHKVIIRPPHP